MLGDVKKILEQKDKIYHRVLDLLEKKASMIKHGGVNFNQNDKNNITLEQAMRESFDRIKKCTH